jgi:hypothetical protein
LGVSFHLSAVCFLFVHILFIICLSLPLSLWLFLNTASIRALLLFHVLPVAHNYIPFRTHHSYVFDEFRRHGNNDTACIYCDINKYRTCLRVVLFPGLNMSSPCRLPVVLHWTFDYGILDLFLSLHTVPRFQVELQSSPSFENQKKGVSRECILQFVSEQTTVV